MLKSLEAKPGQNPPKEGKLYNPDIPVRGLPKGSREVVRDRFYTSMKLGGAPRNASGYSIARAGGLPNLNPRRQEFLLEGAIDPANIRARHNPLRAPPNSYAQGAEGFRYQLPESTSRSRNSVALIQKARQSYGNRLNRLQPQSVPVREQGMPMVPPT